MSQGAIRYMPLALLRDPHHVVSIADEIESFFDVTLYNGLRYLPHNTDHELMTWIQHYFDDYVKDYGHTRIGGMGERVLLRLRLSRVLRRRTDSHFWTRRRAPTLFESQIYAVMFPFTLQE